MTISQVAAMHDISADTLRYYERIGLLPRVHRKENGLRDYTQEDCNWVHFIKCMRGAGISIETLIEYVSLFEQGAASVPIRKELLTAQRDKLAFRISEMQVVLDRLNAKIDGYEERMLECEQKLNLW